MESLPNLADQQRPVNVTRLTFRHGWTLATPESMFLVRLFHGAGGQGLRRFCTWRGNSSITCPDFPRRTGAKKVLDNIHLQFYPDAKIGILGPNGAGKSTVLRIMAGIDKEFHRRGLAGRRQDLRIPAAGAAARRVQDVMENVMEGVADKKAILDRYNELMMNYSEETAEEGAQLQDLIDSQNLWDLESQVEQAMDALRCPPGDADGRQSVWR
jgi:ATPase subunit of ABC transporter with duplicated ATPase domains